MKTDPENLFNTVKNWLSEFAETKVEFYTYPRQVDKTTITVQPSEVGSSKKSGEIQALVIITMDSKNENAAIELIKLVQQVQSKFIKSQQINSNLEKICKEISEIESAKIIAPDPHQVTAQAVLNFKFSFV